MRQTRFVEHGPHEDKKRHGQQQPVFDDAGIDARDADLKEGERQFADEGEKDAGPPQNQGDRIAAENPKQQEDHHGQRERVFDHDRLSGLPVINSRRRRIVSPTPAMASSEKPMGMKAFRAKRS